jgi:hypothetical protein
VEISALVHNQASYVVHVFWCITTGRIEVTDQFAACKIERGNGEKQQAVDRKCVAPFYSSFEL